MPNEITYFEFFTLVALIAGPVVAVIIARGMDDYRAKRERRMDIFRTLMRTRRNPMWPEHVGALNLVEVEFQGEDGVIEAWKVLIGHLGETHTRRPNEEKNDNMKPEDKQECDNRYWQRLTEERQRLLAKVIHAIAKLMGFSAEQLEIFEGGYTPQGWNTVELQQDIIRRYVVDLFYGRRVVPVGVVDYAQGNTEQVKTEGIDQVPTKLDDDQSSSGAE